MRVNEKQMLITRKEIDFNKIRIYSVTERLKEKRKLNNEHLSRVRNLTPEEIVKDKSMIELNYMIDELEEVQQYFIGLVRKLK